MTFASSGGIASAGEAYRHANNLRRIAAKSSNIQVSYPDSKPRSAEAKDSVINLNPDDAAGRG